MRGNPGYTTANRGNSETLTEIFTAQNYTEDSYYDSKKITQATVQYIVAMVSLGTNNRDGCLPPSC